MNTENAAAEAIEAFLTVRLAQYRYCRLKKMNVRLFNCLLAVFHSNSLGRYTTVKSSLPLRGTVEASRQYKDFLVLVSLGYVVVVRPQTNLGQGRDFKGTSSTIYDITSDGKEFVNGFIEAANSARKTFKSLSNIS